VSPDVGGVVRARAMAKQLDAGLAIIDKRRERAGESEVMNIIGEVDGHHCIMLDDIVDSAGTLCKAAEALTEKGAKKVSAYVSHGVFSEGAVARIEASPLDTLLVTDSIAATPDTAKSAKIKTLSIAPLLAEAVIRINQERSVSSLFS
jgi:ribose-phosphate pyrophosphokinase